MKETWQLGLTAQCYLALTLGMLLPAIGGCEQGRYEGRSVTFGVDWRPHADRPTAKPYVYLEAGYDQRPSWSGSGKKVAIMGTAREIADAYYWGERVVDASVPVDEIDKASPIFEAMYRRFAQDDGAIDLRVHSEVGWELQVGNFEGGVVRDAQSGAGFPNPCRLGPGTYHLQLVKPRGR